MLRLETRVPFILTGISPLTGAERESINNYFGRSSNYLLSPGGLTETIRSQLASSGIKLQATDVANPFIQVFRGSNAIGHDDWIVQYTGWIDSTTPLDLHAIQNRWTTAVVQSMIQSGISLSESEIRRAIDDDYHGGTSRFATERLRTASGAPNFSPMPPPSRASLVFGNEGASGAFVNTGGAGNTGSGGSSNANTGNGGGNTNTGGGGSAGNGNQPQNHGSDNESKTNIAIPAMALVAAIAAALYIKTKDNSDSKTVL